MQGECALIKDLVSTRRREGLLFFSEPLYAALLLCSLGWLAHPAEPIPWYMVLASWYGMLFLPHSLSENECIQAQFHS